MGLDMYLEARVYKDFGSAEVKLDDMVIKSYVVELAYWRKHPNLHGYIVDNFNNGEDKCEDIWLQKENLIQLKEAIKANELPYTSGCFFGESSDEVSQEDIAAVDKAIAFLERKDIQGYKDVYYVSSW